MELWIEGTVEQVIDAGNAGIVSAIATNPSIIAGWTESGMSLEETVTYVCDHVDIPLYVQLHGSSVDAYLAEMESLRAISDQIQPKLVATHAGIAAAKVLARDGLKPLVTTIATLAQAFLAASANAAYIAPYIGRIEDAGVDAYRLVADISDIYQRHGVTTRIAVASVREQQQAINALKAGAPVLVTPYHIYRELLQSDLTNVWIEQFEDDWQRIPHYLGQER